MNVVQDVSNRKHDNTLSMPDDDRNTLIEQAGSSSYSIKDIHSHTQKPHLKNPKLVCNSCIYRGMCAACTS